MVCCYYVLAAKIFKISVPTLKRRQSDDRFSDILQFSLQMQCALRIIILIHVSKEGEGMTALS